MKNMLHAIAKIWDRFGPVPVEYGMFRKVKGEHVFWSVYMLRGNIKVRIGPLWDSAGDCMRFMEAVCTKEEAAYE